MTKNFYSIKLIIKGMKGACKMAEQILFGKCVAEGSGYDVGRGYAEQLRLNGLLREINLVAEDREVTGDALRERQRLLYAVCPGIEAEVAGVCDGLKVRPGRLSVFQEYVACAGRCSQIAALPPITADGHLYLGRSYEFGYKDELCLCVTRRDDLPAQAGFSLMLFGRMDGMNDRGLCVTMSSCAFRQQPEGYGVWFPILLRALLDRCATVGEASDLLRELPIRANDNLLLADAGGHARIAELFSSRTEKRLNLIDGEEFLVATNHYQSEAMRPYDNHRGRHSVRRWKTARQTLLQNRGRMTEERMKELLERRMPDGVSCPYYEDGLGTLRSMVFDVTAGRLQVCYGMPCRENWEEITLEDPCENRVFQVTVENEYAGNPQEFWKMLPPGDLDGK